MRHEAHLVGPGSLAGAFEGHLDRLPGSVLVGDADSAVATLTFDVWGRSRAEAREAAAHLLRPLTAEAADRGAHVALIVSVAEREGLLSRLRRLRRARA